MNFKEHVATDRSVFLNPDEFAELHVLDGVEVSVVVDPLSDNAHPLAYAEGISIVRLTVYATPDALGYTPVQDQNIELDGDIYQVVQVAEEFGVLVIQLERNVG